MKEDPPSPAEATEIARSTFLRDDNYYGCAESALVALQTIFGLENEGDSSAATALNGGIAYSGGMCGAISGAAMALGRLAEQRDNDHREAKRVARRLTQQLITDFEAEFSSSDCRDLIDYKISIPAQHDAFIASNVWRTTCMRQIEFSVSKLAALADENVWNNQVAILGD
jgi:C_GCAxxG_C_C family probable redox protein